MIITLKAARVNAGMTIQEAADKIGIKRGTLANWEDVRIINPIKTIYKDKIAEIYKITIDDIKWPNEEQGERNNDEK